ncbi:sugar phosphate isomerase/epimerase family protein [Membranihabitans marinus]|uniref:sugar phosphate isomerase/epimerase family protein n=1 Tax=Membranihabitans marinus TaxID=1227546 RepID=UPI001F281BC0|nr:sugar phosphate isomerase/epimerase family protein [Membranihabitans marinus]
MVKEIIKIGLLALLCINIGCGIANKGNNSLQPSQLGAVSYTFRVSLGEDIPSTLDRIKALGITNMEFSSLFGASARDLRSMLDERGMICTSYGTSYSRIQEDLDKVISEAKTLGAKYVRVAYISHTAPFDKSHADHAIEVFNTAGKKLKENGLTFCYHNHGYEFRPYKDGTFYDYIVENTDPNYVSFELDILWVAHPGHDPVALIQKYGDRMRLMHLKDLKKGVVGDFSGRTPVENDVVLGTGQIDMKGVLEAAKDSNIEYFYIEDESPQPYQQVPESMIFLKEYFK